MSTGNGKRARSYSTHHSIHLINPINHSNQSFQSFKLFNDKSGFSFIYMSMTEWEGGIGRLDGLIELNEEMNIFGSARPDDSQGRTAPRPLFEQSHGSF
jgi:hypothetical protein